MNWLARVVALSAALATVSPVQAAQQGLHPLQLLGGLHRIQDSIARGDHSALTLQPDMISLVDEGFQRELKGKGVPPDQVRPLLVFALGGGGAQPASRLLEQVPPDHPDYKIVQGTLAYIVGNAEKAREMFAGVNVLEVGVPLAAYVALAKGTVNISGDRKEAVRDFDYARLLAPGTLIEEVALRRLLSIHLALKDAAGFSLVAQQYAHRYINSPFASQFVKIYVPGVVRFGDAIPRRDITNLISTLHHDQRIAVLMRLARTAAIAGKLDLTAFTSAELSREAAGTDTISKTRLKLYKNLAKVTSPEANEALANLIDIREADLPEEDQPLLEAARGLANAIVGPAALPPTPAAPEPMRSEYLARREPSDAEVKALPDGQPVEAKSETGSSAFDASFDDLMSNARKKLNSIDELIKE